MLAISFRTILVWSIYSIRFHWWRFKNHVPFLNRMRAKLRTSIVQLAELAGWVYILLPTILGFWLSTATGCPKKMILRFSSIKSEISIQCQSSDIVIIQIEWQDERYMTLTCALDISVRSGSFSFRYRPALIVWATPTLILKKNSPIRPPPRLMAVHAVTFSEWSGLVSTLSGTLEPQVNRVARVHVPAEPEVHFVSEPETVEDSSANHCAIFSRLLLSSSVSFWRTCILYGWRRISLRRMGFSEVCFSLRL